MTCTIDEIESLVNKCEFDLAISKLNTLLSNEIPSPSALYLIAKIAFLNGKTDAAKELILSLMKDDETVEEKYRKLYEDINKSEILRDFEAANEKNEIFKVLKYGYQILKQDSKNLRVHMILSERLFAMGKAKLAHKHVLKALELDPNNQDLVDNMISYLHYIPDTSKDLILEYAQLTRSKARVTNQNKYIHRTLNFSNKKSMLKVGFVSGDFKSHALFLWIGDLFSKLKDFDIDTYCYCNNTKDQVTEIWSKRVEHWRDIQNINDDVVYKMIQNDEIDILIDLSGHTTLNRLALFALKPAPIQISWLGQSGPFGIDGIDYIISDKNLVLEDEDKFYLEKVYRMPDFYSSFNVNDAFYLDREIKSSPYKVNGYISFACFNNMIKLNNECFNTWIQILKSVEGSKLHLKNHGINNPDIQEYINNYFSSRGIEKDRLVLEPASNTRGEYLDSYYNVDICLDPFPVGGCTTSIDAIFIGIPIISLYGNKMPHRATASILKNLNYSELIAYSKEEYIEKAVNLAKSTEQIDSYRNSIRDRFLKSKIADSSEFAKNFSDAMKIIWKEYHNA